MLNSVKPGRDTLKCTHQAGDEWVVVVDKFLNIWLI
jgi:uncharacterized cupin superfamily protein